MDATLQTLFVAHSRMVTDQLFADPLSGVEVVAEQLFGKTEKAAVAAAEAKIFIQSNKGKLNGDTLDLFYQTVAKRPNAW